MRRTPKSLILLAFFFVTFGACSHRTPEQIERDYQRLSPAAVVLACEGVSPENSCGLTAVDALAQYFDLPLESSHRLVLRREIAETGTASVARVRAALEESGYRVVVFSGELSRAEAGVFRHLELGRPMIVLTSDADQPGVFRLMTGFDRDPDRILLFSPPGGIHAWPEEAFVERWDRKDRLVILALPDTHERPKGEDRP